MNPDASVAAIAMHRHGLVTRTQALAAGMSRRMIDERMRRGRWTLERRGVYAIAGSPPSLRRSVLAAILALGDGAVASHLTAALLWGLAFPAPDAIELTGRHGRLEGVSAHQTKTLAPVDVTTLGAIPILSPARTIVACSGRVSPQRLGEVTDDALRRGLVTLAALKECHGRVATGPGRRHTVALRAVLSERTPGYRPGDSQPEADLVRLLAAANIPAPVLGHPVRIGRWRYRLDIAWPEALFALEHDGWDTHRTFTAFHGDRQRLRRLTAAGWTILPVTAQTDRIELVRDVTSVLTSRLATA
jgi:very-short-patch-repair endonuclease